MPRTDARAEGLSSGARASVTLARMRSLGRALLWASAAGLLLHCSVNQTGLTDDGAVQTGTAGTSAPAGVGGNGANAGTAGNAGIADRRDPAAAGASSSPALPVKGAAVVTQPVASRERPAPGREEARPQAGHGQRRHERRRRHRR